MNLYEIADLRERIVAGIQANTGRTDRLKSVTEIINKVAAASTTATDLPFSGTDIAALCIQMFYAGEREGRKNLKAEIDKL